ncbi:MAG TPA: prolyl oligopeptidase family serine peptidase [Puia sp.]|nr:prolyl oligopeptidase family serine peptidase [Puia sp.]
MKKIFLFVLLPLQLFGQTPSFHSFRNFPFTTQLCTSLKGSKLAWALNEEGRRNIYVAEGPDYKPRKLTEYAVDDGQEITSLTISPDGKWVVFVRGGDHGGNFDIDRPVNPSSEDTASKVQVASVPFTGGRVHFLSEGDGPAVSDRDSVAFIKEGQVLAAPIDGSGTARSLFTTRGAVSSLEWSPDGKNLLFVADRGDHSLLGVYNYSSTTIKWIAPSFNRDIYPHFSPDGNKIAFIRVPAVGGEPDSIMANTRLPWSIYIADVSSARAQLLWNAPATLRGSLPGFEGEPNLNWAAGDHIVFYSYHDGWPHLYSIPSIGGEAILLTPGDFMVEHIKLSADKKHLVFVVNSGNDQRDIDRRHVAVVSVDKPDMKIVTQGTGAEWSPVMMDGDGTIAAISATPQRPPLPAIVNRDNGTIHLLAAENIPADFAENKFVTPKQIMINSADGFVIHAQLFEPANKVGKAPAIVFVHGGPERQMLLAWHYFDYYANTYACNEYLANLGFVVLSVNYRLGIGYGYEFHKPQHAGPAGASEYQDVKAAGEWLQKQPGVDAGKIGIYGGSYGGYLTALALARDSKIFAAGVDIHGVNDWASFTSMSMDKNKYEKAPDFDKAVETAWLSSPVSSISSWKSPVLIIHADDDRNVPFNQSVDLINRLRKQNISFETLMITDDTHHWMGFDHSIKVFSAVADFFVRQFKK